MAPLSIQSALERLSQASRAIQRRNGVQNKEAKRIRDAVALLRRGCPVDSRGESRQKIYLEFLRKVLELSGRPMVVLCAVGLGLSVIAIAKDSVRLDLPYEIKDNSSLDNAVLRRLANQYFNTGMGPVSAHTGPQPVTSPLLGPQSVSVGFADREENQEEHSRQQLDSTLSTPGTKEDPPIIHPGAQQETGDVYELAPEDIRQIIASDQISGQIWLTDTNGADTRSFVRIPITNELTNQLILHRPRVTRDELSS
ncbi:hypothetical protein CDV55_100410 [Aspergillus turcosus]|uniref:Uncharacterized protein n=1 Tax=Aspergillus turcosus TaxID=1245748 RepID=A0A229YFJ0_9EURO|nr:hypothetical protein CDV55_100410 [Aspergillus turcosus]RLL93912.1 hypothetical protein CFD26_100446 [Aspergillus turcosus]